MYKRQAQKGTLYEGVADQKATFAISAKNVDMTTLKAQWGGDHTGLTESLSTDGKTLTVTTDATVKQGTYSPVSYTHLDVYKRQCLCYLNAPQKTVFTSVL